ncbi:NUDIX hydrolase [Haloarchaeobius salinus]|uniref:NUDIX hydrolase n=1 Tax=Haloarchaeobius salinus TaxID=1198298 RepID=UPI00210AD0C3|nr:NUDIX hydrolase [Haloarchaeobius salinus]
MSDAPPPWEELDESTLESDGLVQRPTPSQVSAATARTLRFGAKALVTSRDRVLLVREQRDDGSTFWTLPGGGLEHGETARECLARELREEIACGCTPGAIVARCQYQHTTRPDTTTLYTVFETTLADQPTPNGSEDVIACEWIDPAHPPSGTIDPFETIIARLTR